MNTREKQAPDRVRQAIACGLLRQRMVRQVAALAEQVREIDADECPELRLRTAALWVAELAYSCECMARELGAPPLILSDRERAWDAELADPHGVGALEAPAERHADRVGVQDQAFNRYWISAEEEA